MGTSERGAPTPHSAQRSAEHLIHRDRSGLKPVKLWKFDPISAPKAATRCQNPRGKLRLATPKGMKNLAYGQNLSRGFSLPSKPCPCMYIPPCPTAMLSCFFLPFAATFFLFWEMSSL